MLTLLAAALLTIALYETWLEHAERADHAKGVESTGRIP
jgi:hypothetical protein